MGEQGLGRQQEGRADDAAVERADAADDHHQQEIQHDVDPQHRFGVRVAHPHHVAAPEDRGDDAAEGRGGDLEGKRPEAERLRPQLVVADGLERPAERGVDEPGHHEKEDEADRQDEVVSDQTPRDGDAAEPPAIVAHREDPRQRGAQTVLAARDMGELDGQDQGELREGERDHGEEDRLDAEGEGSDQHSDGRGEGDARQEARCQMGVCRRPELAERERHGIGAEAEEHGVAEGDDPRVPQDDVVARDEGGEDRDLRGEVQHLEGGHHQGDQGGQDEARQPQIWRGLSKAAHPLGLARQLDGREAVRAHLPAPKSPVGRSRRISTMIAMLIPIAALGTRNAT